MTAAQWKALAKKLYRELHDPLRAGPIVTHFLEAHLQFESGGAFDLIERLRTHPIRPCRQDGCEQYSFKNGLCSKHFTEKEVTTYCLEHGEVLTRIGQKKQIVRRCR
jgi:hypothetical protein